MYIAVTAGFDAPTVEMYLKKTWKLHIFSLSEHTSQVHINPIVILRSKNTIIIIHFKTTSCTAEGEKFKTNCTLTVHLYGQKKKHFWHKPCPTIHVLLHICARTGFISVFMFMWILCVCIICNRPEHRVKCGCPNCCLSQRS